MFNLCLAGLVAVGLSQSPNRLDVRPPAIAFPDWVEVEHTEGPFEYTVTFPSSVASPYPDNDHVDLRVFLPEERSGPIPCVLILHYWGATDLRVERAMAMELTQRKIGAAIMTLPYHLGRTPAGHKTGELAIEPDPERLRRTMFQSVQDARRSIDFLAQRKEFDSTKFGVAGTSLGSIVAAGTFGVDDRLKHAAFLLGGADLAHILWTSSRVVIQRDILRRRGFTEEKLRDALDDVEPSSYLRARRDGTSFVVGGLFDTVIPHESTVALARALPTPQVLWLETGHYGGIFVQRRLMRLVAQCFDASFAGRSFVAPDGIYAPTVRIGVMAGSLGGFDLGGGLDLFKLDRRGEEFGTLFITPRGPQIFVGKVISRGLSFGANLSTRGFGVGLMWSAVL